MNKGRQLLPIYIFGFFTSMHLFSAVLVPFYTGFGGIPFNKVMTTAMLLQSWFSFWMFVFETPTGFVADRYGRKWSLAIGGITAAIGFLIYAAYPSLVCFAIGELLVALGAAFSSGADEALIYELSLDRRLNYKQLMGRYSASRMLGMAGGAAIGSLIAGAFGVRYPMLLTPIPMVLSLLVLLMVPEVKVEKTTDNYWQTFKQGAKNIASDPKLLLVTVNFVVIAMLGNISIWLYQPLLMHLAVDQKYLGFVQGAIVIGEMLLLYLVVGRVKQTLRYLLLLSVVAGFGLLALSRYLPAMPSVVLTVAVCSLLLTSGPVFSDLINRCIDRAPGGKQIRATTMSSLSALRRVGLAVFDPLMGVMADKGLSALYAGLGLVLLGFAVVWNLVARRVIEER